MSDYYGSFTPSMTGEATARSYMSMLIKATCGVFRLSLASLNALAAYRENRPSSDVSDLFRQRYGDDIEIIYDILVCQFYTPGTIDAYTRIIGELLLWKRQNREGNLTPADLPVFLDHLIDNRRTTEQAESVHRDLRGQGLRYVAYHAVKTVADGFLGWNLIGDNPMPERPAPAGVLALEHVQALYEAVEEDRELVLLILANGLNLAPRHMVGLRWSQFGPGCNSLTLEEKGITRQLDIVSAYSRLLERCRRQAGTQPFLFASNRVGNPQHIGVRTLQNILQTVRERSSVDKRVTLTILRKSDAHVPVRTHQEGRVETGNLRDADGGARSAEPLESIHQPPVKSSVQQESSAAAATMAQPGRMGELNEATDTVTCGQALEACCFPESERGKVPTDSKTESPVGFASRDVTQ